MSEKTTSEKPTGERKPPRDREAERAQRRETARRTVSTLRARLAGLVWLVCVVCALLLALGALLVALKANPQNDLVEFVKRGADAVDLGVFSRTEGIKQFDGDNAGMKNALFNWGLGAVAWLVVGRILDKLIRG